MLLLLLEQKVGWMICMIWINEHEHTISDFFQGITCGIFFIFFQDWSYSSIYCSALCGMEVGRDQQTLQKNICMTDGLNEHFF